MGRTTRQLRENAIDMVRSGIGTRASAWVADMHGHIEDLEVEVDSYRERNVRLTAEIVAARAAATVLRDERDQARRDLEHALKEQARLRDEVLRLTECLAVADHDRVDMAMDREISLCTCDEIMEGHSEDCGYTKASRPTTCPTCNEPVGPHQGCSCDEAR